MSTLACLRAHAICLAVVALSACQSHAPPAAPVPARMVAGQTGAQCTDQMQTAVRRANGGPVVLTPAAFSTDDRLSIVPSVTVLDAAGQPASGRVLGSPDTFRLTLSSGVCTMVRESDGQATPLSACTCVALR